MDQSDLGLLIELWLINKPSCSSFAPHLSEAEAVPESRIFVGKSPSYLFLYLIHFEIVVRQQHLLEQPELSCFI